MDRADDLRGGRVDEPHLDPAQLEVTLFERAYAIILGAVLRNDLTGNVERAWRVADMVVAAWYEGHWSGGAVS